MKIENRQSAIGNRKSQIPEIIAHRGASHDAPENTLAAIQLAWRQNADAVEVDVQLSKDRHLVVIHDATTSKTAGVRRKVAAQMLAELQSLDVGRWKHRKWKGEKIPTLAAALATIPEGKRLLVEVKCGLESIPEFIETFKRSGKQPNQGAPIGFSLETMTQLKKALPELQVCWIATFKRAWNGVWSPRAEKLVQQTKQAGLDGLDLSGRGPVDAAFARKVHDAGLKLYIWTVDSPRRAKKFIDAGVDGITTNRPGWLRAQLDAV